MRKALLLAACSAALAVSGCKYVGDDPNRSGANVENTKYPEQVFWGDTHLHTDNSVDAFGFGNRLNSEQALRFAPRRRGNRDQGSQGKAIPSARFPCHLRSQRCHGSNQSDQGSAPYRADGR